jgi:hypothetical protein
LEYCRSDAQFATVLTSSTTCGVRKTGCSYKPDLLKYREATAKINSRCKELMAHVNTDWIRNVAENPKRISPTARPYIAVRAKSSDS